MNVIRKNKRIRSGIRQTNTGIRQINTPLSTNKPKGFIECAILTLMIVMSAFSKNNVFLLLAALTVLVFATAFTLAGCGTQEEKADGASFTAQTSIKTSEFSESAAQTGNGASIDTSSTAKGFVAVKATSTSQLKFQILYNDQAQNYDLPKNGQPIICPLSFGDGAYTFRVMQNTSGNNYVELFSTQATVTLEDEFAPFLVPNVFCNYSESSSCVAKARELVSSAQTQGEAVQAICSYITENISYDDNKAQELKNASGYIPNPDETLQSGSGICFDYASLGAAMLRSQGIPTKIVTGYVSPNNIYHAWIMVYIDGSWKNAHFSVDKNTWSRVDLTFAASSNSATVGDGKNYTDRYIY